MFPPKRILFPVDFSERCRKAAAYVEAMAGRFESDLLLLHAIPPISYNTTLEEERPVKPADFEKFFGPDLNFLRVSYLIETGEPAELIVDAAQSRHIDLIMMPTQGLGKYRRLILGSNTTKVLHDADCPVWTGAHLEHAPALDQISTRRILCAVDLAPPSQQVFSWAAQLAAEYQAELTLAHVVPETSGEDEVPDLGVQAREMLKQLRDSAHADAQLRVEAGDPSKMVAVIAADIKADLVVIGRRAEPGSLGRLETTAYAIIRRSPCPVVSV